MSPGEPVQEHRLAHLSSRVPTWWPGCGVCMEVGAHLVLPSLVVALTDL